MAGGDSPSLSDPKERVRVSKFISLILRHQPEKVGITLDPGGWVDVKTLLEAMDRQGTRLSRADLEAMAVASDKQRWEFSADGRRIRATHGHSVKLDLGYEPVEPPEWLYHGTATRHLDSIRKRGLHAGERLYVHLSRDPQAARTVGQRHGRPVVLKIHSGLMHREGYTFHCSESGIYLTERVPAEFIEGAGDGD